MIVWWKQWMGLQTPNIYLKYQSINPSVNQSINQSIRLIQHNPTIDAASLSPLLTAAKVKERNKVTKWRHKVKKLARKEIFQKIISYKKGAIIALFRKPRLSNILCSNDLLFCRPLYWPAFLKYFLKRLHLYKFCNLKFTLFSNICVIL